MLRKEEPEVICQALVDQALLRGSQDNSSALLVCVDELPETTLSEALLPADERALPPRLKEGQTFEGWTVTRLLGESRQSLVYRVMDAAQQPWLLKTLPPSRQDDAEARRNLVLEEWFMRKVAGEQVPELHPLPARRHLYYVMREYEGVTLAQQKQSEGLLSIAQWRDIASKLIKAVGLLHRRNLLHRDIKPENLLAGSDGVLRLLDFGLTYCPGCPAGNPEGSLARQAISRRKPLPAPSPLPSRTSTAPASRFITC